MITTIDTNDRSRLDSPGGITEGIAAMFSTITAAKPLDGFFSAPFRIGCCFANLQFEMPIDMAVYQIEQSD